MRCGNGKMLLKAMVTLTSDLWGQTSRTEILQLSF